MIKAGVPVIPGSDGEVYTAEEAPRDCRAYWISLWMLKASAGGGGKGIRKVEKPEDLVAALNLLPQKLKLLWKWCHVYGTVIYPARHIEVQILADQHGHVIQLR